MAKPTTLPRWGVTGAGGEGANNVAPTSGQQDTGYGTGGVVPTSGALNWLFRRVYEWLSWAGKGTPVDPDDLANKAYVDGQIGAVAPFALAAADQTNATTTPQGSTQGLTVPVVANGLYEIEFEVLLNVMTGGTYVDIGLTGPASPTNLEWGGFFNTWGGGNYLTALVEIGLWNAWGLVHTQVGAASTHRLNLRALLRNGANAGNVTLQFFATGSYTVTILKDSMVKWRKLA